MCILFRTIETNAVTIRVKAGCIWGEGEESYRVLFLCAIYLLIRVGREIRFILFHQSLFLPPREKLKTDCTAFPVTLR